MQDPGIFPRRPQVMLIGLAGCGKTQSCTGLLKKLNPEADGLGGGNGERTVGRLRWYWKD